ncbi:helix-turn-helix domain-containing protein [Companilactobacillus halodurans]|uniref:Helix-turn-helix transcriptional regulator n=1 Tax=Companilactobacillus halodurans TaxID=2584183 RepID=A0A5P0ZR54_9LACO|nr:helix-turn-helix transcriptional regulator [Companilactobacillus halodurans]MQS76744.1 helix-turn-helix transcriptional regulator [Companilactobacillus halodurans]MQS97505.1 helix-turn-helix transcriptional regulator [Companilactobacillus halodurans]
MKNLGMVLKELRQEKKMTQKELADGICAQSMLSAIENDIYVPNANLLINLVNRLEVDLNEISLAVNFKISQNDKINEIVDKLCNAHQYQQLLNFLNQKDVLDNLETSKQIQAYYYYLGVAQLQTNAIDEALKSLRLSLAEINHLHLTTISRLAYLAIGYIYALQNKRTAAVDNIDLAFRNWNEFSYDENQNIIYYLTALIYFKLNDYQNSTAYLIDGITFIAKHDSHYMLANCYFLMARLAQEAHQDDERLEAHGRKDLFSELYNEQIFKDF